MVSTDLPKGEGCHYVKQLFIIPFLRSLTEKGKESDQHMPDSFFRDPEHQKTRKAFVFKSTRRTSRGYAGLQFKMGLRTSVPCEHQVPKAVKTCIVSCALKRHG
jgi:hypothetical protein